MSSWPREESWKLSENWSTVKRTRCKMLKQNKKVNIMVLFDYCRFVFFSRMESINNHTCLVKVIFLENLFNGHTQWVNACPYFYYCKGVLSSLYVSKLCTLFAHTPITYTRIVLKWLQNEIVEQKMECFNLYISLFFNCHL